MPAYGSSLGEIEAAEACGAALLPLRTKKRGPAQRSPEGEVDIIDEALTYYRANVLFATFSMSTGADRTMAYLTLFIGYCMKLLDRVGDVREAQRKVLEVGARPFAVPGDPEWVLGTMFPAPSSRTESDAFKAYFKQAREETAERLLAKLYKEDGTKNKWWAMFGKRKFMGLEMKDL
uniref:Actin-related protein 2/3 complex subunit 3 n=1 Tax=Pinguiococcus pyrenoidosus TaxID=172671 RepID=A0A7R9YBM6_9STRA